MRERARRLPTLAAAILLDAAIGDPHAVYHPVQAVGSFAAACERALRPFARTGRRERFAGVAAWSAVGGATYIAASLAERLGGLVRVLMGASVLSFRSLVDHVLPIARALEAQDIDVAREALARVVGRDTHALDAAEISRAAIETLAESTCDGIVAPLLYLTLGGPAAAMCYKAVNTLDSLFGHPEPPYREFGWCSARADDLANVYPSRIAAAAIVAAGQLTERSGADAWTTYRSDCALHRSPNAGHCEAAMAGALRVRLGGSNAYGGVRQESPHLGERFAAPGARDVRRAIRITACAALLCYAAAATAAALLDAWSTR